MSALFTLRNALIALAVGLAMALGFETDWGSALTAPTSIPARAAAGKHDNAAVLPDFRLGSEATNYAQISERPLLNPTRKPAPTQVVVAATEPPRPQVRRGLYQLIGVLDLGTVKVAQVREIASNRTNSVREGDALQEMTVKKVDATQVTLGFQGETDVLELPKYTASGRVPQPAPPPVPVAMATPPPQPMIAAMSAPPRMPTPTAIPGQTVDNGGTVATVSAQMAATIESRRLAREQQGQQTPSTPPGTPGTFGPARPQQ